MEADLTAGERLVRIQFAHLIRRLALLGTTLAAPALGLAFAIGGRWAAPVAAGLSALLLFALLFLGASNRRPLGRWGWSLAVGGALYVAGLVVVLLPAASRIDLLGLPAATALLLYLLVPLPLLASCLVYAAVFDRWTLREEDLAALRRNRTGRGPSAPAPLSGAGAGQGR
jgi:hypothetical protein